MKLLILGSTGMLGQALNKYYRQLGYEISTVARKHADYNFDMAYNVGEICELINKNRYDVVINTAANVNLVSCEEKPEEAYLINARAPGLISNACKKTGSYFIQISTDHYYESDQRLHTEEDSIVILNEYARTKYLGEVLTLLNKKSLVVRTNIIGFRGTEKSTFAEWVIKTLNENKSIVGFKDFYTNSIDVNSFSEILHKVIKNNTTGIINIAARNTVSKFEFIQFIAKKLGKEQLILPGLLKNLEQSVQRGNTLGLSTERLASIIGEKNIPSTEEVIERLLKDYKEEWIK